MEKDKFEDFKIKFEKIVSEKIQEHQKVPSISIDTTIEIEDLNRDFLISTEN
jgi:single-stranded-DNA-specific exonuclease